MTFVVYEDSAGKYRWRLKGGNGEIVATSGEAFANKSNADRAAEGFKTQRPVHTMSMRTLPATTAGGPRLVMERRLLPQARLSRASQTHSGPPITLGTMQGTPLGQSET